MRTDATFPLTARAPGEVIFRRGAMPVTAARFLAEVAALAARLPADGPVLNFCADRYLALVAFAAALSRGHATLLSADRSPQRLADIARLHGARYALADTDVALPLPVLRPEAAPSEAAPNPVIRADRVAAIAFTSGSTGEPRPHAKPWGALVAGARAAAARFAVTPCTGIVGTVPAQHMYGFETTLMLPLQGGGAGHAGPVFYPSDMAEALAAMPAPRLLVTTPLQMRALLGSGVALPPLRAVISATAPLAAGLAAEAEAAWGAPVLEIYGATEAGSVASRRTLEGDAWLPYDGTAFTITEDGASVTVPGLPAPVPLADTLEALEAGRFRLGGRRADMVKLAGKRASLSGLTSILTGIEGVADGVFLAPPDLDRNPRARLAALVVAPGLTPQAVVAALRGRVEPAFLPRPVVMLRSLPRDPVGKLRQGDLAALAWPRH
ncbi:AMP-binding protein [Roseomonas eburnea]|uniref:AMP-binding protein n=1 Tax=Neoroseomonas eburnea TaxID=1346889 RepID=A0A9X9XG86_9PROT|nr:AMP-binding protein [Neoroseomonas eburnea]MBR0682722.1 AMP-binding protein [Neoroseomonas eburnea]